MQESQASPIALASLAITSSLSMEIGANKRESEIWQLVIFSGVIIGVPLVIEPCNPDENIPREWQPIRRITMRRTPPQVAVVVATQ
ncbi:hypothetical protein R6Q59_024616 [Mikania micrantha]